MLYKTLSVISLIIVILINYDILPISPVIINVLTLMAFSLTAYDFLKTLLEKTRAIFKDDRIRTDSKIEKYVHFSRYKRANLTPDKPFYLLVAYVMTKEWFLFISMILVIIATAINICVILYFIIIQNCTVIIFTCICLLVVFFIIIASTGIIKCVLKLSPIVVIILSISSPKFSNIYTNSFTNDMAILTFSFIFALYGIQNKKMFRD